MNPSISTIQDFISCPLKFKLKHIAGLRKIEDESADHHLKFGLAWHKAMEVIYTARLEALRNRARYEITQIIVRKAKDAFLAAYPRQLDLNDNAKTQESGLFAIEDYLRKYAGEDARRWKVLAVEAAESYDNGFVTHLDMVAENLEHGGIYGFDFKTTKKALNYDFWRRFEPNSQIARYTDFIKSKYGSCEGFYIRATQFGYRSRTYKGEPVGFYVKHEAQLFNVNEVQIKMERRSNNYWTTKINQAIYSDVWGMNTDHCPFCPYRKICMSGWTVEDDIDLILNQYRVVCNQLTSNLRACALDVGHTGKCSEDTPRETTDDMTIEVEI